MRRLCGCTHAVPLRSSLSRSFSIPRSPCTGGTSLDPRTNPANVRTPFTHCHPRLPGRKEGRAGRGSTEPADDTEHAGKSGWTATSQPSVHRLATANVAEAWTRRPEAVRSEEHTSELQS